MSHALLKLAAIYFGVWASEPTVMISPPSSWYRFKISILGFGSLRPFVKPPVLSSSPFSFSIR